MNRKVVISVNSAWNLVNFRSGIISSLVSQNYEVIAVAADDKYSDQLKPIGCRFIPINIDSKGTNILKEIFLFIQITWLLCREKPDVFLAYTVKLNIYGTFAAHLLGIPVVNNIAGLGSVFTNKNLLSFFVAKLYKLSLAHSSKVFFQNQEDLNFFVKSGLVANFLAERLPGSGIDINKFFPQPIPERFPIRFLLIARMLWEKGVGEFVKASMLVKKRGLDAEFCLLGFLDVQNPGAITKDQMNMWEDEGIIRYLGVSDDVRNEIAQANCIVLPSFYREGTPRALLEAASMARPIITTDWVGCRDVVDNGINGFLCRPKDAEDLTKKMLLMYKLSHDEREEMGANGRKKMIGEFDEKIVINRYLNNIKRIILQYTYPDKVKFV